MSGHSKWHSIKHKKAATDAKRGKIFTKHAKLIQIAARGGGNPEDNPALRTAIDNAKADNVPNDNIDRAIKKGSGELKGEQIQELVYEAYGPGGAAFIIECLTDNTNRTLPNIKKILSKTGGRFAESGSVMWMFEQKGEVVAGGAAMDEELELALIDAGADDIQSEGNNLRVITPKNVWPKVRDVLKSKNCTIASGKLSYIAKDTLPVDQATMEKINQLIDALDEDDDVSEVYANI